MAIFHALTPELREALEQEQVGEITRLNGDRATKPIYRETVTCEEDGEEIGLGELYYQELPQGEIWCAEHYLDQLVRQATDLLAEYTAARNRATEAQRQVNAHHQG